MDAADRVPDLVFALTAAGARVTRVEPHEPTLEDLYFAVRQIVRAQPARRRRREHRLMAADHRRPPTKGVRTLHWGHVWTVARTDLKQLAQARDYWIPMLILGGDLLRVRADRAALHDHAARQRRRREPALARPSRCSPSRPRPRSRATPSRPGPATPSPSTCSPPSRWSCPITISTAVGAATIVGERERGTGEFLAHSPAGIREIFLGKLAASLLPGYLTTIVGFGIYALIVNTIVGPDVGGWFFPTSQWWVLMLWVVPAVPRPDPQPRAAAVGQGEVHRRRPAGVRPREPPADHGRLQPGHRQPLRRQRASPGTSARIAWVLAGIALWRGVRVVTRGRLLGVADEQ